MAKRKYPSELNSKTIRINLGTYLVLAELAAKNGVTIAQALDWLIASQAMPARPTVARSQMPMPVLSSQAMTAISVNGNRSISFGVRPKGGILDDE